MQSAKIMPLENMALFGNSSNAEHITYTSPPVLSKYYTYMQYSTIQYSTIQYSTIQYSTCIYGIVLNLYVLK